MSTCPQCGAKTEWRIAHPGTAETVVCASFEEAMELFEGFNLPSQTVNGVLEPFDDSHERVKAHFRKHEPPRSTAL